MLQLFKLSILTRKISLIIIGIFAFMIAAYGNIKTIRESFEFGMLVTEIVYAYIEMAMVPLLGYMVLRIIMYIFKKRAVNTLTILKDIFMSWLATFIWIGFVSAYHWISLGEFMVLVLIGFSVYSYLFPKPLIDINRLKRIIF